MSTRESARNQRNGEQALRLSIRRFGQGYEQKNKEHQKPIRKTGNQEPRNHATVMRDPALKGDLKEGK